MLEENEARREVIDGLVVLPGAHCVSIGPGRGRRREADGVGSSGCARAGAGDRGGVAFGGSGRKKLAARVTALEEQVLAQQQQIDDLVGRVTALEGGGRGGGGGGGQGFGTPSAPQPGLVIDQQQTSGSEKSDGFYNTDNTLYTPLGQQFTPASDSLAAVSLWTDVCTCLPGEVSARDADIVIHEGPDLTGDVLGTGSLTISGPPFPGEDRAWLSALFDPAVVLTPGQVYTMELQTTDGTGVALLWYLAGDDLYPGGCAMVGGMVTCSSDMAFVTWAPG